MRIEEITTSNQYIILSNENINQFLNLVKLNEELVDKDINNRLIQISSTPVSGNPYYVSYVFLSKLRRDGKIVSHLRIEHIMRKYDDVELVDEKVFLTRDGKTEKVFPTYIGFQKQTYTGILFFEDDSDRESFNASLAMMLGDTVELDFKTYDR